ncbi:MAG: diguanylate cyclase [Desulfosarcinaceae bacterium]
MTSLSAKSKESIAVLCMIWMALVATSFTWTYHLRKQEQQAIGFHTAKSFFEQILVTRSWSARFGGVYVPITDTTQPNPYLDDPLKVIHAREGFSLTKINPSYMTRQISDLTMQRDEVRFDLTGFKPLRPQNSPTPMQKEALEQFKAGVKEVGRIIQSPQGQDTFFYMAPLKAEKDCLTCHAGQGFREGEIMGGISVTLPHMPKISSVALAVGHGLIGGLGLAGILFFGASLNRAYQKLRDQAIIDALTGIPNRRHLEDRLASEFDRSKRERSPLSLIMVDVDRFKDFNDFYGHRPGDECLQRIAQAMQAAINRPGDFCARYGGEEFVVLLPQTASVGALSVAERIRLAIAGLEIPHEASSHAKVVTASLGVATRDESNAVLSSEDLIKKADAALYRAKQAGRNRVVGADDREIVPLQPAGVPR